MASRVGRGGRRRQPEGGVKAMAMQALHAWGCDVISNTTGTATRRKTLADGREREYRIRFGKKGSGDILALSPHGRWVEVETKATTGLGPDQVARKAIVEAKGGVYVVVRRFEDLEGRKADVLARPAWTP